MAGHGVSRVLDWPQPQAAICQNPLMTDLRDRLQLALGAAHTLDREFHGLALAYAGRRADAIAEGERGVAPLPVGETVRMTPLSLTP